MKIKVFCSAFVRVLIALSGYFCSVHSFVQYNCTDTCAGLEKSDENFTEVPSVEVNEDVDVFNLTAAEPNLKFATPCETPNHEVSYCIEISKCTVLKDVHGKIKYSSFIEASRCGPENEDQSDLKVCCGKYNSFRNVSKIDERHSKSSSSLLPDDTTILPKVCGTQKFLIRSRIVGGTEASLGEYPWMARIIHKNAYGNKSYGCAGFLIHVKYIVTAAHCIHSEFSQIRGDPYSVLLGEHNMTTKIDCSPGGTICAEPVQVSRIRKIVVHANYNATSRNHHNDIALIHLNKAIRLSEFVQPICLLEEPAEEVKKYYISGWGKTEKFESSPVKMKVELTPFDQEDCKEKFDQLNLEITDSQICAGGEKMKDSCNGDSGGPLMIHNSTRYYAAGLVSYGIGCGMEGWPGVYTNVPSYVDWIKSNMVEISTRTSTVKKNRKKKKVPASI